MLLDSSLYSNNRVQPAEPHGPWPIPICCCSQRSLSEDPDSGIVSSDDGILDASKRSFARQVSKVTVVSAATRKWAATTVKRKQRWAKHVAQKET